MIPHTYRALAELLRRRSGMTLGRTTPAQIADKLTPTARLFGFRDVAALLTELEHPPEELAQAVTEAMTTRETSFFRDTDAFTCFETSLLPTLLAARAPRKRLRLWCAGVATGQEAYSLAIILDRLGLPAAGWKIELLATDLCTDAVIRARNGVYSSFEVERGLSEPLRSAYFAADGNSWRVSDRLRRAVSFRTFNLLDDFGWLGEMDVAFCRNVLFYLEPRSRASALKRLSESLAPDGYLVLGLQDANIGIPSFLNPLPGVRAVFAKSMAEAPRLAPRRV